MPRYKRRAHLIEQDGMKECSECGMMFPENVEPSLDRAFSDHVRKEHDRNEEEEEEEEDLRHATARIAKGCG